MWRSLAVVCVLGCGSSTVPKRSAPAVPCLADQLGPLRNLDQLDTTCTKSSCKDACDRGDASACMLHGYVLQRAEDEPRADERFARGCKLGLAIGCTNFGASFWMKSKSDAEDACAMRLFERACEVNESFGCGMVGRMLAQNAKTDTDRAYARAHFERVCSKLGAMTCRMYAHHLERGDFGARDPARVKDLLQRACDTGDDDACDHDTAGETFH